MDEPSWVKTASSHAVITKAELMEWLKVNTYELRALIASQGLPPPRFTGSKNSSLLTARSRWRVGDVRAWLDGRRNVAAELSISAKQAPDSKTPLNHWWRNH